jgi:hypothetical protein
MKQGIAVASPSLLGRRENKPTNTVGRFKFLRAAFVAGGVLLFTLPAVAHTLPISYLRLVPDADYLHLELVFNPFELTFMSKVDENHDAELNPAELAAHGQAVADRVAGALKVTVGGREVRPETAGMDPDLNGHHVRLRAHYKADARRSPLTLDSGLISITSASHLTQVTYAHADGVQRAQLDSQSRRVTFTPPPEKKASSPAVRTTAIFGGFLLLLAVLALLAAGVGFLLFLRRRIG